MARVSRKPGHKEAEARVAEVFRTAIYLRLSVEDNGKKDADSLENQEALLREYVAARPYLALSEVYSDNGFTGTDFDRPAFQRMLDDVRTGKIDCIVVKDLSRLGRNYVESGNLLEKVFPFLGVRFIAINDNYDSESLSSSEELGASLKNLINDIYAKDVSRKSGTALKAKRLRGEYIGSYAPYGYLKDPADRNHLVPDPETADAVKEIFSLRAEGNGIGTIARILNERNIPSPGHLRFQRGIYTNNNQRGYDLPWNRHVLSDILKNVVYIGHLTQGRSGSALHRGIPFHRTEEWEWDMVENTHEPIIDQELWDRVQTVNAQSAQKYKAEYGKYGALPKRQNPYGSLLRCADCGRVLKQVHSYSRNRKKVYFNYKCPENIELGDGACPKKSIRADDLDAAVLAIIRQQMDLFLDTQKVLRECLEKTKVKARQKALAEQMRTIRREIDKRKGQCADIYTDYKDGILSQEEYLYAKKKYQEEIDCMEREVTELEGVQKNAEKLVDGEQKWVQLVERYYSASSITTDMVQAMIKGMTLDADNNLSIDFLYMDEFEKLMGACKALRKEAA